MRLILVLGASLTVALASYGDAAAASPGYGAPPVAGPYQAPPQQAPQYPAPYPYPYMHGSSSSSSSSSSSESSSGSSSGSSESNERDTCTNNLTSTACPTWFESMAEENTKIVCTAPTTKSIRLRDGKQRLVVLCATSDTESMTSIAVGASMIAGGKGTQEAVVTCHSSNVWTALGGPLPHIREPLYFASAWCVQVITIETDGRRRRHMNATSGSDDLPKMVSKMNLSTMQEQQTTVSSVDPTQATEATGAESTNGV